MQMSYGEIVRSYKEAKEQKKQIGILADLNAVGKDEIAKILYDAGEINKMTYGQYQRHGKKAVKTETPTAAETCAQAAPDGDFCRAEEASTRTAPDAGPYRRHGAVHVPEAVIEMTRGALKEMKSAYERAKNVVAQYEEMEAFLAAATTDKAE